MKFYISDVQFRGIKNIRLWVTLICTYIDFNELILSIVHNIKTKYNMLFISHKNRIRSTWI